MEKDKVEHQPREHSVPCSICRRPTWNVSAVCDHCTENVLPKIELNRKAHEDT